MQIQHFPKLNGLYSWAHPTCTLNSFGEMDAKKRRQHDKHAWYHSKATTIQNTTIRRGPQSRFGRKNTALMVTRLEAIPPRKTHMKLCTTLRIDPCRPLHRRGFVCIRHQPHASNTLASAPSSGTLVFQQQRTNNQLFNMYQCSTNRCKQKSSDSLRLEFRIKKLVVALFFHVATST